MTRKYVVAMAAALAFAATASLASAASILLSKHDLSTGKLGAGNSQTAEVCVFCHTPHNAVKNIPLWNRSNPSESTFQLYSSTTMKNHYGSATGLTSDSISLFCLSCHDGGNLGGRISSTGRPSDFNGANVVTGTNLSGDKITAGNANLGTNLMNDHPVNFNVTNATGLKALVTGTSSPTLGGFPLYKSARGASSMECSSCHKVHDPAQSPFLRASNAASSLCLACHDK